MIMALKMESIKEMKQNALEKKISELEMEIIVAGKTQGTKISSIKLSIARMKTYLSQLKKGIFK